MPTDHSIRSALPAVDLPPFDVAALRDNAESWPSPPLDPVELQRVWVAFVADLLAAADEIDRLAGMLEERDG